MKSLPAAALWEDFRARQSRQSGQRPDGLAEFNAAAGLATLWTRDQRPPTTSMAAQNFHRVLCGSTNSRAFSSSTASALDETNIWSACATRVEPLMTDTVPLTFFGHTHLQGGL